MEPEHILKVDSLSKSVGRKALVSNAFLSLSTGRVTGLVGRNGSGKTSVMNLVFGLEKADFIYLQIDDNLIRKRRYFSKYIAYSPEFNTLPDNLTGEKCAELMLPSNTLKNFFEESPLQEQYRKKNKNLSKGSKNFLQSVLALKSDKPFCLLDEPFKNLSPLLCDELQHIIKIASKNKGILVSSHKHALLDRISNNFYFINEGRLSSSL